MLDDSLAADLHRQLERLDPDQQRAVLEFARTLASAPPPPPPPLSRFAGTIPRGVADAIREAIERDCEV